MAYLSSATIKGITYNRGDKFICPVETTGFSTASGDGSSVPAHVGETWYFVGYEDGGYAYPYAVKWDSAPTSSGDITAWYSEDIFPAATYTVSYNANGGSGAPSAQTKTHGTTLKLSSTVPKREGYKFIGWSTSSTGSTVYNAGANYTANAPVTLYAVWEVQGLAYIDDGTVSGYMAYIDNGTSFDLYVGYIDNGTSWDLLA